MSTSGQIGNRATTEKNDTPGQPYIFQYDLHKLALEITLAFSCFSSMQSVDSGQKHDFLSRLISHFSFLYCRFSWSCNSSKDLICLKVQKNRLEAAKVSTNWRVDITRDQRKWRPLNGKGKETNRMILKVIVFSTLRFFLYQTL